MGRNKIVVKKAAIIYLILLLLLLLQYIAMKAKNYLVTMVIRSLYSHMNGVLR